MRTVFDRASQIQGHNARDVCVGKQMLPDPQLSWPTVCSAMLAWVALTLWGEGCSHLSPRPVRCCHVSARAAATQGGVLCSVFAFQLHTVCAQQPSHVVRCAPLDGVSVCKSGGGRPMFYSAVIHAC